MRQTISKNEFVEAFEAMGRSDNFSRAGRRALFEFLEELEDDLGEEIELDPIALCCDWSEFASAKEACAEYGLDEDESERLNLEILREHTDALVVEDFHFDDDGKKITQTSVLVNSF